MSKIKNYIMNSVEKQVDKITNEYVERSYRRILLKIKSQISTISHG